MTRIKLSKSSAAVLKQSKRITVTRTMLQTRLSCLPRCQSARPDH